MGEEVEGGDARAEGGSTHPRRWGVGLWFAGASSSSALPRGNGSVHSQATGELAAVIGGGAGELARSP